MGGVDALLMDPTGPPLAPPPAPHLYSTLTSLSRYVTRDVIMARDASPTSQLHHDVMRSAMPPSDWMASVDGRGQARNVTGFDLLDDDEELGPGWTEDYPEAWLYVGPVLLALGVVGNVLTFLVMRRARMRGTATSVYLQLLAIADTLALISRIPPEFFKALGLFVFSEISRWTCKFEKFLFYTSSDVAIWILVLFTLDRFIAVSFPLSKHARDSVPRRAALLCLLITLLACAKNLHVFWTRDIEYWPDGGGVRRICGRPPEYFVYEERVRPWIAFVLISVLPCCVILTCNCFMVRTLVRARLRRHATTALLVMGPRSRSSVIGRSFFTQTTLMCVSASLAFVVCVTPSIVLTVGRVKWSVDPESREAYYLARAITHQLACLNHAINFFMYCVSGQRFRRELVAMLACRGDRGGSWGEAGGASWAGSSSRVLQQRSVSVSSRSPVSPIFFSPSQPPLISPGLPSDVLKDSTPPLLDPPRSGNCLMIR